MTQILSLSSSLHSDQAQSSQLAAQFIERWQAQHGAADVVHRDLSANPIPHLTADRFAAFRTPEAERTDEQSADVALFDQLVAELQQADVIVLALPMYNFGIPSTLKSYIDHIARAGLTFQYTATGPQGLLKGKRAYIMATRGGRYAGTEKDTQTRYLIDFLGFIGIEDVEFVYAEGLAMGDDAREHAVADAIANIETLAA